MMMSNKQLSRHSKIQFSSCEFEFFYKKVKEMILETALLFTGTPSVLITRRAAIITMKINQVMIISHALFYPFFCVLLIPRDNHMENVPLVF